jgi:phasin family protein
MWRVMLHRINERHRRLQVLSRRYARRYALSYQEAAMSSFETTARFPFASAHYSKAWGFRLPPLSFDKLFEAYQKNLAALAHANQAAFDGFSTLAQRQAALLNETAEECSRGMNDVLAAASLEEKTRRQADSARHAYESTFSRFGELCEIAMKAHMAAAEILNARLTDALDELKGLFVVPAEPEPAPTGAPGPAVAEPLAITAVTVEAVPMAEPAPIDIEPLATIAEAIVQSEERVEDEDADDPIAPNPAKPRSPRTAGGSSARSARRPPSRR